MKNYVEKYLDDNEDVYENYFDHLCNTLAYQSPMDLSFWERLFRNWSKMPSEHIHSEYKICLGLSI